MLNRFFVRAWMVVWFLLVYPITVGSFAIACLTALIAWPTLREINRQGSMFKEDIVSFTVEAWETLRTGKIPF